MPEQSAKWQVPFGFSLRTELFPQERAFFKGRPEVAGMAARDGRIIINPFTNLSPEQIQSVINNEALRLRLRRQGMTPAFGVTPEQQKMFKGTEYATDPQAMRETIAARTFAGDRSFGFAPTNEQTQWIRRYLGGMNGRRQG